ncbi:LOW QUALITY PROTEIN: 1-aminocyclopropane-1-carboxylate synthase-like protein 1 [Petaurus breviceps papuanus]|uniref:LOW QUALITY PROTEIN: 1-aminocyclopropane-1-carboxylate synthase-like protein 1 n=1 Tax=Petaurus breviceps papuanus TaxID=3040969 RepID=UPI0036DA23F5
MRGPAHQAELTSPFLRFPGSASSGLHVLAELGTRQYPGVGLGRRSGKDMFSNFKQEARGLATSPATPYTQYLGTNHGEDPDRESFGKIDKEPVDFYGLGDPVASFSQMSPYLSSRGSTIKCFRDTAKKGYKAYHLDEYDEDKNPNGIINFGTSENKLCFDLLSSRLTQRDMHHIEPPLLQYPDWKGHMWLRDEVAGFLSYYCKAPVPLKPENVVVVNGCASLFSALATVLCDPGEAFLISSPYYGAITQHVYLYGNVQLVYAHLDSRVTGMDSRPFQLTVKKLEIALQGAKSEGINVKGLILINPQNPLGDIYSQEQLQECLEFAKRCGLTPPCPPPLPDPQRTHVIWGTSKDFGISGFRFGTLYTENQDVANAVASLGCLHSLCGTVQYQMAQLLRDRDWINQVYLPENHARLRAAHAYITEELETLNIPFLRTKAGFFVWIDLRKYLFTDTFEEEFSLWSRFLDHKVLLFRGKDFECKEPGWFRLVFSDKIHRLRLGMQRIREVLEKEPQVAKTPSPASPWRRAASRGDVASDSGPKELDTKCRLETRFPHLFGCRITRGKPGVACPRRENVLWIVGHLSLLCMILKQNEQKIAWYSWLGLLSLGVLSPFLKHQTEIEAFPLRVLMFSPLVIQ